MSLRQDVSIQPSDVIDVLGQGAKTKESLHFLKRRPKKVCTFWKSAREIACFCWACGSFRWDSCIPL